MSASAWPYAVRALFFSPVPASRQSVPRCGAAPQGAAPRRPPYRFPQPDHKNDMEVHTMTIINLRDFYYWYTQDEYMEVTDDVAEALRASVRYEAAYLDNNFLGERLSESYRLHGNETKQPYNQYQRCPRQSLEKFVLLLH